MDVSYLGAYPISEIKEEVEEILKVTPTGFKITVMKDCPCLGAERDRVGEPRETPQERKRY